jgi:hypothetical protein
VGVPISQQTEFDHRLAEPVYTTKTKADGSFQLKDVEKLTITWPLKTAVVGDIMQNLNDFANA